MVPPSILNACRLLYPEPLRWLCCATRMVHAMCTDADIFDGDGGEDAADAITLNAPVGAIFAITLWQPWATLWAAGVKRFETRSWSTPIRGRVLIHAALKWDAETIAACHAKSIRHALEQLGHVGLDMKFLKDLPRGVIIGSADITAMIPTERAVHQISTRERAFGDYSRNRFAWQSSSQLMFDTPVRASGRQKLWLPDADVLEQCRAAIARAEAKRDDAQADRGEPRRHFDGSNQQRTEASDAGALKTGR